MHRLTFVARADPYQRSGEHLHTSRGGIANREVEGERHYVEDNRDTCRNDEHDARSFDMNDGSYPKQGIPSMRQ